MKVARILALALLIIPAVAQAWWNKDWTQRTAVTLNTTAAGVQTQAAITNLVVPVRLHSGNYDFVGARPDGSDLRVVAGDDKTLLKFSVERFDSVNELAILWVMVPSVLPGTDKNTIYVYAGNEKTPGPAASGPVFGADTLAVFHFGEKDGSAADESGSIKASAPVTIEPNGLIGHSAHFNDTAVSWPASDKMKVPAGGGLSVAFWIKPDAPPNGELYRQGPMAISLASGALSAQVGTVSLSGGQVAAATWSQIVLAVGGGKMTLYVNGAQAGQGDLPQLPTIDGGVTVGQGYRGLLDELEIAGSAHSAEVVRLGYAAQSADAKLVASKTESVDSSSSSSGSQNYFGILFKSLTPDAWTVIGILGVMFLIAVAVMVTKAIYVTRTAAANRRFLRMFRDSDNLLQLGGDNPRRFSDSSLYRLYMAGLQELTKRDVGGEGQKKISGASLDAVKAAIDADSVREGYRLNAQMVLLTIAISGGPFLGLLGTVIGVMITFAAIAAAGDVNVNAIAPALPPPCSPR